MTTNEAMSKVNRGSHGDFFYFLVIQLTKCQDHGVVIELTL